MDLFISPKFHQLLVITKMSGISLTNNEIKDIIKSIKNLENKGVLLRVTSEKIKAQEGGYLGRFQGLLIKTGLH